jgi:type IV pilus assembly protein PilP
MCNHFLRPLSGPRNGALLKKASMGWKGSAVFFFSIMLISWPVQSLAQAEKAAEAQKAAEIQKPATEIQKPVVEAVSYHYDPKGKTDPFKPFLNLEVAKVTAGKPNPHIARTPLQEVGLEQFKLVGIALGSYKKAAMVEDPKGKGYIISEGTLIGHNHGRVAEILRDRLIVEERFFDGTGKNKTQRTVIKLHKDEKEGRL